MKSKTGLENEESINVEVGDAGAVLVVRIVARIVPDTREPADYFGAASVTRNGKTEVLVPDEDPAFTCKSESGARETVFHRVLRDLRAMEDDEPSLAGLRRKAKSRFREEGSRNPDKTPTTFEHLAGVKLEMVEKIIRSYTWDTSLNVLARIRDSEKPWTKGKDVDGEPVPYPAEAKAVPAATRAIYAAALGWAPDVVLTVCSHVWAHAVASGDDRRLEAIIRAALDCIGVNAKGKVFRVEPDLRVHTATLETCGLEACGVGNEIATALSAAANHGELTRLRLIPSEQPDMLATPERESLGANFDAHDAFMRDKETDGVKAAAKKFLKTIRDAGATLESVTVTEGTR